MERYVGYSLVTLAVVAACGLPHKKANENPSTPVNPLNPPSSGSGSTNAEADSDGTITSGGGYIYGYEANPWFLGNVSTVKYCVDMDETNFGISRSQAEASIERAIDLWKQALKNAKFSNRREEPVGTLVLGTQEFTKVDCNDQNLDLRFQMGTLNSEQKKLLPNPKRFVASTIQTNYDEENMRGRGFIYVSPESGALRPEAEDIAPDFWRVNNQSILDVVLVHELGHVFGMPHTASFPMQSTLCEQVITKPSIALMEELEKSGFLPLMSHNQISTWRDLITEMMEDLFLSRRLNTTISTYYLTENLKFALDSKIENNARLTLDENDNFKITTYSIDFKKNPWVIKKVRDIGKFEVTDKRIETDSILEIRVPRSQKIMKLPEDTFGNMSPLTGSYQTVSLLYATTKVISGYLTNEQTGTKNLMFIRKTPAFVSSSDMAGAQISAVVDGKLIDIE